MMMWIAIYAVVFIGGPLIVLRLMRHPASVTAVRWLGMTTGGLVVAGIAAQMIGVSGLLATAMLWGAWVTSMALMGQVLRLLVDDPGARRWTAAVAAMGATIPWFGILVARAMAG